MALDLVRFLPALLTWCLNLVEEYERENAIASFFNFFDFGLGGGSIILGFVAEAFSYPGCILHIDSSLFTVSTYLSYFYSK